MRCYLIFIAIDVTLLISTLDGILLRGPDDVLAVRGSNVTLPCVTNLSLPVQWEVYKDPPVYWRPIYIGMPSRVPNYLNYKYEVKTDSTQNEYNLIVKNIQPEDSGTYQCIEDYGFGMYLTDQGIPNHSQTAEVVVVENSLSCSEKICRTNQTTCVPEVMVEKNCTLKYSGNIAPTLLWSVISNNSGEQRTLFEPNSDTSLNTGEWRNSFMTSSVKMNSTLLSPGSYIKCYLSNNGRANNKISQFQADLSALSKVFWKSIIINNKGTKNKITDRASLQKWIEGLERAAMKIFSTSVMTTVAVVIIGLLLISFVIYTMKSKYRSCTFNQEVV